MLRLDRILMPFLSPVMAERTKATVTFLLRETSQGVVDYADAPTRGCRNSNEIDHG